MNNGSGCEVVKLLNKWEFGVVVDNYAGTTEGPTTSLFGLIFLGFQNKYDSVQMHDK